MLYYCFVCKRIMFWGPIGLGSVQKPQGDNLYAVWSNHDDDMYAAGDYGTVLHYNGETWLEIEQALTTNRLLCIWSDGFETFFAGERGTVLHHQDEQFQDISRYWNGNYPPN